MSDSAQRNLLRQRVLVIRAAFVLCSLLLSVFSWASGERLPVWKVQGPAGQLVLLGSVHMAEAEIYPLRPEIEQAFAQSDALIVEVDISGDKSPAIQQMVMRNGQLAPDESLQQFLSLATLKKLDRYLRRHGLNPDLYKRFRPGLIVMNLSSLRMRDLGLRSELGIDYHFLQQADGVKRIVELESVEQQLDLLLDFPDQDMLLNQTLDQLADMGSILKPLYEAWKSGDAEELNRQILLSGSDGAQPDQLIYDKLFTERNIQMVGKIKSLLEVPGNYFLVVGAGHLVGEQGIVSLLQKEGYHAQRF